MGSLTHEVLGSCKRHTSDKESLIRLFRFGKNRIKKPYIGCPHLLESFDELTIESDFEKKFLFNKRKGFRTVWTPGINLTTFKNFNGIYPEKEVIVQEIKRLNETDHPDFNLWNMIINGSRLSMIDGNDYDRPSNTTQEQGFLKALETFK